METRCKKHDSVVFEKNSSQYHQFFASFFLNSWTYTFSTLLLFYSSTCIFQGFCRSERELSRTQSCLFCVIRALTTIDLSKDDMNSFLSFLVKIWSQLVQRVVFVQPHHTWIHEFGNISKAAPITTKALAVTHYLQIKNASKIHRNQRKARSMPDITLQTIMG